jgi:archaellum component FlaF (FlaF/FlaG flagellin family)
VKINACSFAFALSAGLVFSGTLFAQTSNSKKTVTQAKKKVADVSLEAQFISDRVVQAIYTLLNQANGSVCTAPTEKDVVAHGLGALTPVSQPTIEPTAILISLTIRCANGAKATISGSDQSYQIVDQNRKSSGFFNAGIQVQDVKLEPAAH